MQLKKKEIRKISSGDLLTDTNGMDNLTCYELGLIAGDVGTRTTRQGVGDEIDRGLILRRILEEKGFGLIKLKEQQTKENK